jgi:hypothetical protein
MNPKYCRTPLRNWLSAITITVMVIAVLAMLPSQNALAANFTVTNNCSYTIYPGIYPQTYSNGGWTMNPGSSVSFTLAAGWNGRMWGRKGCNGSSPAQCTTGSCGGTGLQCAGTTGAGGTSLAEFNLATAAGGTDWYDVSYVDGFDNPIGIVISNTSCVSPNTCTTQPLTSCYGPDLTDGGAECFSPCSATGLPQYCCAGAYGTPATCQAGGTPQSPNWPSQYLSYLTTIHTYCPNEYAYAYDDNVGLHTCVTGSNYTVTFCPNGSGSTGGGGGGGTEGPYGGTAAAVPGTVMAENYDTGGQGTGYSVSSTNGSDNGYRSDGVDLETATAPATGNDLGWTASGQWFRYTVNVATAGTYTVSILVAAPAAVGDAFHLSNSSGSNLSGSVAVPATGGYQTWTTVKANVTLPAGTQTLTVNQDAAGWNIDSLAFALNSSGGGGTTEGPYPSTAAAIPGTVLNENYDTGGQGVAYNVTSTNGTDNGYRSQGVDLETATAPATGNDLGWSAAGQWFRYTVNVSTAGSYAVSFLVASPAAVGDAFHLSNSSGTNLSGSVAVPATGGYQTWTTVKANVTLPAGTQTLTLNEDAAGWNIDSMAFASSGGGGGGAIANGTYVVIPQNATALRLDDVGASTATGNPIDVYTANGTAAQNWAFSNTGVTPAGYYNIATLGAYCLTASGATSGSPAVLDPCAGTSAQAWEAVQSGSNYTFHPASNTALCLDVVSAGTASGTKVQVYTCNGTAAQSWAL